MAEKVKRVSIVCHSGTLDKAYPVLMIASAAGASDMQVDIFFTFWGLTLLKKKGFKRAKLPGIMRLMTPFMRWKIKKTGIASLPDLLKMTLETENVRLYACTATMDIMNVKKKQLIPEVAGFMGAAGFLDIASECDVQLFI
jgi:peroxiredoxin family protein